MTAFIAYLSTSAKLVQSVKLNFLSLYLINKFLTKFSSISVMRNTFIFDISKPFMKATAAPCPTLDGLCQYEIGRRYPYIRHTKFYFDNPFFYQYN
ncbi:MAG: hypothetical protein HW390_3311 [Candidatus Brocadiaceae bacterium]|nr:hypothetical protein [Candidatus Brocadiaceae bacterium]